MVLLIRAFAIVISASFLELLVIVISPLSAFAETFKVYNSDKLTNGHTIIGIGQNLPSLSSSGVWTIDDYPKEEILKSHNQKVVSD